MKLNNGKSIGGLLFVDDFVGMSDVNLSARRLLLLSVLRPSIEYGSEV